MSKASMSKASMSNITKFRETPLAQKIEAPIFNVEATLVADRVTNTNKYLAALATVAIAAPFLAAWVPMPMNARAALLTSSVMASCGFIYVEQNSREVKKYAGYFQKAQEAQLKEKLKMEVVSQTLREKLNQTDSLLEFVLSQPPEKQAYWLQKWGLSGVIRPVQPMTSPGGSTRFVEAVNSPGVSSQPQLSAEMEQQLSSTLDTVWFDKWLLRSGVICGESGDGKCLGKGTPVVMADLSIKNVEDVVVGDHLMGDDSKPRKVLSLARGQEEMFRITPNRGGDSFVCNRSHILSFVSGYNKAGWENGKKYDISVDDYLKLPKTIQRSLYSYRVSAEYVEQPVKIDPYYIGVWLGDGTSLEANAITKPDPEILKLMEEMAIDWSLDLRTRVDARNGCPTHTLCAVDGAKFIPQEYMSNSIEVRLQVLAGIIDTDGYLFSGCCYDIAQKDHVLAEQIIFLARSVGLMVCRNKDRIVNGVIYKRFTINGNTDIIPVRIPRRKADKRLTFKDSMRTGITVESLGMGDYFGFTIDGNHRFLLGDFTVSHNTQCLKYVFLMFMKINPLGKVMIIDLDYGSSHGDTPGNNWFGAELGKVAFNKIDQCFSAIERVYIELNRRSDLNAIEAQYNRPKIQFEPWLLIVDEGQSLWSKFTPEQQKQYLVFMQEILIRGLKQNITFKFGSQSLTVGNIGLNQSVLSQVEIVLLYRAFQNKSNYGNIKDSSESGEIDSLISVGKRMPQKIGNVMLCVTYIGKRFSVAGVPFIEFGEPKQEQTNTVETTAEPVTDSTEWDRAYEEKFGEPPVIPTAETKPARSHLEIHEAIVAQLTEWESWGNVLTDDKIREIYESETSQKITKDYIKYIREVLRKS